MVEFILFLLKIHLSQTKVSNESYSTKYGNELQTVRNGNRSGVVVQYFHAIRIGKWRRICGHRSSATGTRTGDTLDRLFRTLDGKMILLRNKMIRVLISLRSRRLSILMQKSIATFWCALLRRACCRGCRTRRCTECGGIGLRHWSVRN